MIELKAEQFPIAARIFQHTNFGALAAGTLEGGHPGRVFVDNRDRPSMGLVCTRVGYYFIAGASISLAELQTIRDIFLLDLAPEQKKRIEDPQIILFYDSPAWKEALFSLFQEQNPIQIQKKRMTLPGSSSIGWKGWRDQVPSGMRLVEVTMELLEGYPDKAGEIKLFWGSTDQFIEKSLGFWLVEGDTLCSTCEAVFCGDGEAEISIFTAPEYRRKGLAKVVATAFIESCLARGKMPVWGCWPENKPSVDLARSLGFQEDCDQPVCFWEYNQ